MNSYVCPECDAALEECRPFAGSDKQLHLHDRLRIKKQKSDDEFGGGYSDGSEPTYVCWECNTVYRRSDCYINHRKPVGKAAAGGES